MAGILAAIITSLAGAVAAVVVVVLETKKSREASERAATAAHELENHKHGLQEELEKQRAETSATLAQLTGRINAELEGLRADLGTRALLRTRWDEKRASVYFRFIRNVRRAHALGVKTHTAQWVYDEAEEALQKLALDDAGRAAAEHRRDSRLTELNTSKSNLAKLLDESYDLQTWLACISSRKVTDAGLELVAAVGESSYVPKLNAFRQVVREELVADLAATDPIPLDLKPPAGP